MTTKNYTNLLSFHPKIPTCTVAHLNSIRNNFTWNSTVHLERFFAPTNPRITEITEVSIPGTDATVIIDVMDSKMTNNYSNIVSISTLFSKTKI